MKGCVAAIVPAAGSGQRIGAPAGKLFLPLNGRPLLAHTLRVLQASPAIRWIIVVVRPGERARAEALIRRLRITKALPPCIGGPSRAASVANGCAELPREARWVLIHDGVRPCLSSRLIHHAVRAAKRHQAVACGLPAAQTVKVVDARGEVRLTLDRDHLWIVQTPQVFRRKWLAEAFAQADHRLDRFPDDASLVESAGFPVRMIPGEALNVKVTTREDLVLAEAILRRRA